jgi:hypothetical protein
MPSNIAQNNKSLDDLYKETVGQKSLDSLYKETVLTQAAPEDKWKSEIPIISDFYRGEDEFFGNAKPLPKEAPFYRQFVQGIGNMTPGLVVPGGGGTAYNQLAGEAENIMGVLGTKLPGVVQRLVPQMIVGGTLGGAEDPSVKGVAKGAALAGAFHMGIGEPLRKLLGGGEVSPIPEKPSPKMLPAYEPQMPPVINRGPQETTFYVPPAPSKAGPPLDTQANIQNHLASLKKDGPKMGAYEGPGKRQLETQATVAMRRAGILPPIHPMEGFRNYTEPVAGGRKPPMKYDGISSIPEGTVEKLNPESGLYSGVNLGKEYLNVIEHSPTTGKMKTVNVKAEIPVANMDKVGSWIQANKRVPSSLRDKYDALATDVESINQNLAYRPTTTLKRIAPSGAKLADAIDTAQMQSAVRSGNAKADVIEAFGHAPKKAEIQNLRDVAIGEAEPINEGVARAAAVLKDKLFSEAGKEATAKGLKVLRPDGHGGVIEAPFVPMEKYFPREILFEKLKSKSNLNKIYDHMVKTGQAADQGEASRIFDDFIKGKFNRRAGGLEHARVINLPDEFYNQNHLEVLSNYFDDTYRRFAEIDNYGPKDVIKNGIMKDIASEGGDVALAQKIFDRVVGNVDHNKTLGKVQDFSSKWVARALLPLSFIKNLGQGVINVMPLYGVKNTLLAYNEARGFGSTIKSLRSGAQKSLFEGGTGTSAFDKVITGPFAFSEGRINRVVAPIAAQTWLREQFANYMQAPTARLAARIMRRTGIDIAEAAKRGKLTSAELNNAGHKAVKISQFFTGAADMPVALSSQIGSAATTFKKFGIKQGHFISDLVAEARAGDAGPLLAYLALGEIVGGGASYVSDVARGKKPDSASNYLATGILRGAGGFGIASDALQALTFKGQAGQFLLPPQVTIPAQLGAAAVSGGEGFSKAATRYIPYVGPAISNSMKKKKAAQ